MAHMRMMPTHLNKILGKKKIGRISAGSHDDLWACTVAFVPVCVRVRSFFVSVPVDESVLMFHHDSRSICPATHTL